jgi:threonine/homoserine/homoserine lactone efflux protein
VSAGSEVPVWLQLALHGTAVNLILSSGEILVVFLAAFVTERLGVGGSGSVIAQRLSGSVLLSLALHLAFVQDSAW